jgi:hypothetical protein
MPATTSTKLGVLKVSGYDLRIGLREDGNCTKHFEIAALGQSLSDTPLGEVNLTRGGMLYPALTPDAERIGFGPAAPMGAFLIRVLMAVAPVLETDPDLDREPLEIIPLRERQGAEWVR